MTGASELLLTPQQVAKHLGLHVKTVRRYIRDGQLDAVRVGRRYRVSPAALEAFTGVAPPVEPRHDRVFFAEASSIVSIDDVDRAAADRLTTLLVASVQEHEAGASPRRLETVYYPQRHRLKVVTTGDLASNLSMLALLNTLLRDGAGRP